MGRCNGYRPKKEDREEVMRLRAELGKLTTNEWQKASMLMHHITALMGNFHGPSNGMIEPRACKWCDHYGHTTQWCPKRKRDDDRAMDRILDEDRRRLEKYANREAPEPYDATKSGQALEFDRLRVPYTLSPSGVGPIVGCRGDVHAGKWTFDNTGCVVERIS